MNLLFVIDSLGSGSAQKQLVMLASGMKARGHRVDVLIYHPELDFFEAELTAAGISLIKLEKKTRFGLEILKGLITTINQNSHDVALSYLATPNIYLELSSFFTKRNLRGQPHRSDTRSNCELNL